MIFPPYRPMATIYDGTTIHLTCQKFERIYLPELIDGTVMEIDGKNIKVKTKEGIAHCMLFKDYKIKIADTLEYREGRNHKIEENFPEDFIK